MSEYIKMGEISIVERHALKQLIKKKEQKITECTILQEKSKNQYEESKRKLCEIENEIATWCKKIIIDYKIEIIPGANIRIDFENGDILAVLPDGT